MKPWTNFVSSKPFAHILANLNGGEGIPDINLAYRVWVAKKLSPVCLLSSYKESSLVKIARLNHVVITLASGDKGRGFDPHSLQGRSGYSMLEIPYESEGQSNKFSMYIFLPDRKDGLQDLLQMFHSDNDLFYRDFYLEKHKLDELWIPKFKITCKFKAHDVMEEMGLTFPFDPTNKEITEIVGRSI
nr:serpin-ZX [Tanacetum cinerariifolium]